MGTSYFHHAAVDRAVQACEAAGEIGRAHV